LKILIFAGSMRIVRSLYLLMFVVALASCGEYQKIYKGNNRTAKYNMAMKKFSEKEYLKSVQLFEQLRDMYGNRDSLENVYYHIAQCYYGLRDYSYASLIFKDYTENFTQNKRVIECAYMALYCDYLTVGPSDLDQSETNAVIEALQLFTNYYPESSYTEKCNDLIDDLRERLQKKEYDMVIQYYRMGEYQSAVTAARNTVKIYPDINQREELEYIMVHAQYLYADNSITSKKIERFKEVLINFEDYLYNNNSNSEHYWEVKEMAESATEKINKLEELL